MSRPVAAQKSPQMARSGLGQLLGSTGVSMVGQGVVFAAVPLLAATITREPFAVSMVGAATYAAALIVGLPAGALADRWSRRAVMIAADVFRTVLLVGLAVAVWTDHLPLVALIATVFLLASAGTFFDPAAQASIPVLAGRDPHVLARANGRLWTLDIFGRSLIGPPLGAALFAVWAVLPFALNAVTFVVSAALLVRLRNVGRPVHEQPPGTVLQAIKDGASYLLKHRQLRLLTAGMAIYNLGYNVAFGTLVLFAQDRLGLDARGFGVLLAALAIGGLLGGWLAPKIDKHISAAWTYAGCLLLQGLAWLAIAPASSAWLAGTALAAIGLASTVVSVIGGTARQLLTPDHLVGRITAGTRVFGIGAAGLGALLGGAIASGWSLQAAILTAALLLAIAGTAFGFFASRDPR